MHDDRQLVNDMRLMQGYGPPPAYPNLKIPGLNAPIPQAGPVRIASDLCAAHVVLCTCQGAEYGYHPGGWGKPPVDEFAAQTLSRTVGAVDISQWLSAEDPHLWIYRISISQP